MAQSSDIKQQRKKDAYEFALLLYDIFKEEDEAITKDPISQEINPNEGESCQNNP
ncbi:MAG TPA: hypothetical protein VFT87_05645 [Candidatus Saccharimonadales bacterium]|nr:hypothetical protein [Candidatus Saccharimonadales bacterium]